MAELEIWYSTTKMVVEVFPCVIFFHLMHGRKNILFVGQSNTGGIALTIAAITSPLCGAISQSAEKVYIMVRWCAMIWGAGPVYPDKY